MGTEWQRAPKPQEPPGIGHAPRPREGPELLRAGFILLSQKRSKSRRPGAGEGTRGNPKNISFSLSQGSKRPVPKERGGECGNGKEFPGNFLTPQPSPPQPCQDRLANPCPGARFLTGHQRSEATELSRLAAVSFLARPRALGTAWLRGFPRGGYDAQLPRITCGSPQAGGVGPTLRHTGQHPEN